MADEGSNGLDLAAALAEKYRRLLALRHAVGIGGRPDEAARTELRAIARRWPGALRELDSLDSDELERRAAACRDPGDADWIRWMSRYHELMRTALALRRGEVVGPIDAAFAAAVARPQHGRLNVVVFAQMSAEVGRPAAELWNRLFPRRGSAPRRYRD